MKKASKEIVTLNRIVGKKFAPQLMSYRMYHKGWARLI